jgi:hypothetical protein
MPSVTLVESRAVDPADTLGDWFVAEIERDPTCTFFG